ncbi:cupin domain-containing protein [Spirosoma sp. HMF4905]|uniref:Cupin domain-containing protein n=1 Tax=Spirosoma arboris TaxID=2682092 RepID=A0A7K1SML9_9BACT|nr:cupin domain-containing protein [Spirosoma arboris]MVM35045.1 cupin domain-containing protein [Spirosoma arboris]
MKTIILLGGLMLVGNLPGKAQSTGNAIPAQTAIFPKGDKAPATNFTGTVWVQTLVPNDSTMNCLVGSVTFEPGARSNWHTHPTGQILLITAGTGYYQEKGKPIQIMHMGDVFKCQPNIEHWHGASPTSMMSHISILPNMEKGNAVWLRKVTDQEYNNLK